MHRCRLMFDSCREVWFMGTALQLQTFTIRMLFEAETSPFSFTANWDLVLRKDDKCVHIGLQYTHLLIPLWSTYFPCQINCVFFSDILLSITSYGLEARNSYLLKHCLLKLFLTRFSNVISYVFQNNTNSVIRKLYPKFDYESFFDSTWNDQNCSIRRL